ncbi:MAG: hypothetical protein RLZZ500_2373 [Bacteroidota bacterium]|jgi:hypothetical protein
MKIKVFFLVCFCLGISSCRKEPVLSTAAFPTQNGWGYTVSIDQKITIKQTIIPVIDGNQSFVSKQDALKTAQLVLRKLKRFGNPTITKYEIDSLQIKYKNVSHH